MIKFDRQTWLRFIRIVRPFFTSEMRGWAWGLLALLAVFDVIPATIAQIVPLAMLPFIARRKACTLKAC